jgi:hypothetical protein
MQRRRAGGFHADDPDLGALLLDRDCDAADESAATHRDHDRVEVGDVLEEFEPDRALAGDDGRVVVRRDPARPSRLATDNVGVRYSLVPMVSRAARTASSPTMDSPFDVGTQQPGTHLSDGDVDVLHLEELLDAEPPTFAADA